MAKLDEQVVSTLPQQLIEAAAKAASLVNLVTVAQQLGKVRGYRRVSEESDEATPAQNPSVVYLTGSVDLEAASKILADRAKRLQERLNVFHLFPQNNSVLPNAEVDRRGQSDPEK